MELEYLWSTACAFHKDGTLEAEAWVDPQFIKLLDGRSGSENVKSMRRMAKTHDLDKAAACPSRRPHLGEGGARHHRRVLRQAGTRRSRRLRVVTMDIWQGYIGAVKAHAPQGSLRRSRESWAIRRSRRGHEAGIDHFRAQLALADPKSDEFRKIGPRRGISITWRDL